MERWYFSSSRNVCVIFVVEGFDFKREKKCSNYFGKLIVVYVTLIIITLYFNAKEFCIKHLVKYIDTLDCDDIKFNSLKTANSSTYLYNISFGVIHLLLQERILKKKSKNCSMLLIE